MCGAAGYPDLTPAHEPPRKINPVSRRRAGIERARRVLRFEASVSLAEGLRRTAAWYADSAAMKQMEAR